MASGSKVIGIYGFCDIRNFTDTTEELQEGVMMFVNEIAQIVHGLVDKYLGAANKNIGDAFLLVWKFQKDELFLNEDDKIVRNPVSKRAQYLPDVTMISFLKIMAKVNKDPAILKYRTNQKLLQRMPNYEVKMGFGMHLGWAIEGAIGSQFKIDASYLSPNVNVASALEGSTKIYGVPLLISGPLYESFSEPIQRYCRHIDTVVIKGNAKPLKLYTSDCDFTDFTPSRGADRSKMYFRKKRRILKKGLDKQEFTTADMYSRSKE
jgi:class 3 adenylate cyclase